MSVCVTGQPNTTVMTEIYVKVEPGEKEFEVEDGHIPKIRLNAEAEQGKANAELLRQLTRILGERPAIISGHKSRRKKLKLSMPEEKARQKISEVAK